MAKSGWRNRPVSNDQLVFIGKLQAKLGTDVTVPELMTQGDASELIDHLRTEIDEARKAKYAAIRAERDAKASTAPLITAGKQEFTGTIQQAKWTDGKFATTAKMMVVADNGNAIWSTVPRAILDSVQNDPSKLRGKAIKVYAVIIPSKDNPHFAFASRPKAQLG